MFSHGTDRERERGREGEGKGGRKGEREHPSESMRVVWSLPLITRTLIPSWEPHLMTISKPNYLAKTLSPNTVILGVRVSTYDLWWDTCSPWHQPLPQFAEWH